MGWFALPRWLRHAGSLRQAPPRPGHLHRHQYSGSLRSVRLSSSVWPIQTRHTPVLTFSLIQSRPVYSLTNYLVLGRTLYYVPYLSPIHPGRVISTFLGLDLIVAVLTANGAAKVSNFSNSLGQIKEGKGEIRASILLQVACFLAFIALVGVFHRRCLRANVVRPKLRPVINLLYASSALIVIRNIYRVVNIFQGYDGYVETHEAFFYVFDGGLMLINSVIFNVYHPRLYLPRSNKIYLSRDGVTELKGPGWKDKRPVLVTILDPMDLVGLVRGKDMNTRFWDNEDVVLPTAEVPPGVGLEEETHRR